MHRKIARSLALAALTSASLVGARTALAWPTVTVPCNSAALASAMASAGADGTLNLARACVYRQAVLPAVTANLTIDGNGATLKHSGNLTVSQTAIVTITSLNFRQTRIVILGAADVNITGSTFTGDTGIDGGAIEDHSYAGPGGLQVTRCTFTGNTASGGGAIYDDGDLGAYITDSAFYRNHAGGGGAILDASQFGAGIVNSVLAGNTATFDGGAVASVSDFGAGISGSRLTRNHADLGGAVYDTSGPLIITDTLIRGNTASQDGGGVYADENPRELPQPVTLDDDTITRNYAGGNGGGLYDNLWQATATGTTITRNTAGGGGGGIYLGSGAAVTLTTSLVTRNQPDNCEPANMVTGCIG